MFGFAGNGTYKIEKARFPVLQGMTGLRAPDGKVCSAGSGSCGSREQSVFQLCRVHKQHAVPYFDNSEGWCALCGT